MERALAAMFKTVDESLDAVEVALRGGDLSAAALSNDWFDKRLRELLAHLSPTLPLEALASSCGRLQPILARHRRLTDSLAALRRATADELAKVRQGHRGASAFLETAQA